MANRSDTSDSSDLIGRDEIDVLFGTVSPNPERIGCPPRSVLAALARRERPIGDPAYEHLTGCSPCYREFRALQQQAAVPVPGARASPWWPAAAAVLLIGLAAGIWLSVRVPDVPRTPVQAPALAEVRVQIDLRPYAVVRSERGPGSLPALALSRGYVNLTMLLPVGSEPGRYEVRLLNGASMPLASASAMGEIRDFVTTLDVMLDLRAAPPGAYRLAVRREGEDWTLYPAALR